MKRYLWVAAEAELADAHPQGRSPSPQLEAAVEMLRPIFGERKTTSSH